MTKKTGAGNKYTRLKVEKSNETRKVETRI